MDQCLSTRSKVCPHRWRCLKASEGCSAFLFFTQQVTVRFQALLVCIRINFASCYANPRVYRPTDLRHRTRIFAGRYINFSGLYDVDWRLGPDSKSGFHLHADNGRTGKDLLSINDKNNVLSRLKTYSPLVLELGCGSRKRDPEAIGIDKLDFSGVDIVGDVCEVLGQLPSCSVDRVHGYHFIEHVEDLERLIEILAK